MVMESRIKSVMTSLEVTAFLTRQPPQKLTPGKGELSYTGQSYKAAVQERSRTGANEDWRGSCR